MDCFRKILGNVGTIVDLDKATLNSEQVEYARLKVRTTVKSKVRISKKMWINDEVYQVSVEEEASYVDREHLSGWYKEVALFDMKSPMETRVGDNLQ